VDFFANSESFRVKSNFYVDNIQSPDIKIENISAQLNFQNSILDVALSQASAFGGDVNGEINVNFIAESPSMTAHVKGLNLQIDSILKFMQASQINIYPNTKISGMGNIELDVTSNGIEINSLIRNLDGTSQISISNGLFMGKDWDEIVTNLAASNHAITNETISENFRIFRFKQLTASFKIKNGIFFNDDLLIDSSTINVKGKGQINFPNNSIDYLLQAELQNTYNGTDNIILATLPLSGSLV
jgi:AsmA protein